MKNSTDRKSLYMKHLSHDLKNVLNNIKLSSQMAKDCLNRERSLTLNLKYLSIIEKQANFGHHLLENVSRLFLLGDANQLSFHQMELLESLEQAIADFRAVFGKDTNLLD